MPDLHGGTIHLKFWLTVAFSGLYHQMYIINFLAHSLLSLPISQSDSQAEGGREREREREREICASYS